MTPDSPCQDLDVLTAACYYSGGSCGPAVMTLSRHKNGWYNWVDNFKFVCVAKIDMVDMMCCSIMPVFVKMTFSPIVIKCPSLWPYLLSTEADVIASPGVRKENFSPPSILPIDHDKAALCWFPCTLL